MSPTLQVSSGGCIFPRSLNCEPLLQWVWSQKSWHCKAWDLILKLQKSKLVRLH
jgi:hypothetical protein